MRVADPDVWVEGTHIAMASTPRSAAQYGTTASGRALQNARATAPLRTEGARAQGYCPTIKTFLYLHSGDLERARDFYTNVLGLNEIYFSDEEQSVGYQVGSVQITIGQHSEARHVERWSSQLGWQGGTASDPSWGFHLEVEPFRDAVERSRRQRSEVYRAEPEWVGYWSFPVKDPMGNTVEISSTDPGAWPPPGINA